MREMADAGWEYASFSFSAFLLIAIDSYVCANDVNPAEQFRPQSRVLLQGLLIHQLQNLANCLYSREMNALCHYKPHT